MVTNLVDEDATLRKLVLLPHRLDEADVLEALLQPGDDAKADRSFADVLPAQGRARGEERGGGRKGGRYGGSEGGTGGGRREAGTEGGSGAVNEGCGDVFYFVAVHDNPPPNHQAW